MLSGGVSLVMLGLVWNTSCSRIVERHLIVTYSTARHDRILISSTPTARLGFICFGIGPRHQKSRSGLVHRHEVCWQCADRRSAPNGNDEMAVWCRKEKTCLQDRR